MATINALELAYLCDDVYYEHEQAFDQPALKQHHWKRSEYSVSGNSTHNAVFSRIYAKMINNKTVATAIAFRGTLIDKLGNLEDDIDIALNLTPAHFKQAYYLFSASLMLSLKYYQQLPLVIGHSLGGAYAQLCAIKSRHHPQAVVFNSPGVADLPGVNKNQIYNYITNVNSEFGLINKIGDRVGKEIVINVNNGITHGLAAQQVEHSRELIAGPSAGAAGLGAAEMENLYSLDQHLLRHLIKAMRQEDTAQFNL